jgi:hypothetical protein
MGYYKTYDSVWAGAVPGVNAGDTNPVTVANRFQSDVLCYLVGARYFRDLADGGSHLAIVRDNVTGAIIRAAPFRYKPASGSGAEGWETTYFSPRVTVPAGGEIDLSVWFSAGQYSRLLDALAGSPIVNGHLTMQIDDPLGRRNGRYSYGTTLFADLTYRSSAYGIDPLIWVPT